MQDPNPESRGPYFLFNLQLFFLPTFSLCHKHFDSENNKQHRFSPKYGVQINMKNLISKINDLYSHTYSNDRQPPAIKSFASQKFCNIVLVSCRSNKKIS